MFRNIIKYAIILLLVTMPFTLITSDDAPVEPTQSGNIMPVYNTDIEMKSERIDIYLNEDDYDVVVEYVFHNTGKAQAISMGFPNVNKEPYLVPPITDFEAYENGNKKEIYTKSADDSFYKFKEYVEIFPNTDTNKYHLSMLRDMPVVFECFDTYFKAGETKNIKNKYSQDYYINYGGSKRFLAYILKSGAFWKGKIGKIDLYIHLDKIPEYERKNQIVYETYYPDIDDDLEDLKSIEKWIVKPEKYTEWKGNTIEMHIENIEPDFNMEMFMPMPIVYYLEASSTLYSSKNAYSVENLYDNDTDTAWVEGKKDSGIGESVKLNINESGGDSTARKITGLKIINGYAKSKDIFYKNNRVKKMKITTGQSILTENPDDPEDYAVFVNKEQEKIITLEDTMKPQIINIDSEGFTNYIICEILEVYKGTKYNDTCITEIQPITETE